MQGFQSTLPREERPIQSSLMVTKYDFNPRSHERSDIEAAAKTAIMGISIHAPTRGATVKKQLVNHARIISIHAPTRGATIDCGVIDNWRLFQSTLPREERPQHYLIFKPYARISIHAPTRGATNSELVNGHEV